MKVSTRKFDSMTHKYNLSKTLRMSLIPVGKTAENFEKRNYIEKDKQLKINSNSAKLIMDRYYRQFIDDTLSKVDLTDLLNDYAQLYYSKNDITDMEEKLRESIANAFGKQVKKLFKADFIKNILPEYLTDEDELKLIKSFSGFTTYFYGYWEIRKSIFAKEDKSNTIAYRCINDNLPKFLDNINIFECVLSSFPSAAIESLRIESQELYSVLLDAMFKLDYFNKVLPQSGISIYNDIVGRLNKEINLYNQQIERNKRISLMKPLFKQILSESTSLYSIPKSFESDVEVIEAIQNEFSFSDEEGGVYSLNEVINELENCFSHFDEYDFDHIFISNGDGINLISNHIFPGEWSAIRDSWNAEYDRDNIKKKSTKTYESNRDKAYKEIEYFSLDSLQKYADLYDSAAQPKYTVSGYLKNGALERIKSVKDNFLNAAQILSSPDSVEKLNKNNSSSAALIKLLLDSVKDLERFIKPLICNDSKYEPDEMFYSVFVPLFERLSNSDSLYNSVRNYITKKPYSTEKIKINFDNSQFLNGWDISKENVYLSVILIKDECYYLAVIDKSNGEVLTDINAASDNNEIYHKMCYKLLPSPNKMLPKVAFAKSNNKLFSPSNEIIKIRKSESFKKGDNFNLSDCHKFIDFYKDVISKYDKWQVFDFKFRPTQEYADISEFYNEVAEQGYSVSFSDIPASYIDTLVDEGKIYLFRIYNKDMSEHSKGMPNLHTMYFKMLFAPENLKDVVYKLNGDTEMFYRPASLKLEDTAIHHAGDKLKNKNPGNNRPTSEFSYDLIKDKRYTEPKFMLHIPININYKQGKPSKLNDDICGAVKQAGGSYVIGIDRGERNLIYVSVVAPDCSIVYQHSFNIIKNVYNDNEHKIDYHKLLDNKEKERKKARSNWTEITNIKNLKEGYISQVVHEICQLVIKYDAVIAMEDLNTGFKRGRYKFEKQVYQKFESMLIDKLSYYVDKNIAYDDKPGSLLNAYQLTIPTSKSNQNGIIFYVPAWCISKIDPVTGFADLLHPKYKNMKDAKDFISKFDSIKYNPEHDYFEFCFDYKNFSGAKFDFRRKWTVCTFGDRIVQFCNKDKNNEWDGKLISITVEMKNLFSAYKINYTADDLQAAVLSCNEAQFFEKFIRYIRLTLQMRNTMPGDGSIDYLISPVKDKNGVFFDSRKYNETDMLPCDADANGAYNIARKGMMKIQNICESKKTAITNESWLKFVQSGD